MPKLQFAEKKYASDFLSVLHYGYCCWTPNSCLQSYKTLLI